VRVAKACALTPADRLKQPRWETVGGVRIVPRRTERHHAVVRPAPRL